MPPKPRNSVHFTRAALEEIAAPEAGRATWYDDEMRGLAFVVTAKGAKSFYLIRRIGARVERLRLGPYPRVTIDQARRMASGHNGSIDSTGASPMDPIRKSRSAPTLAALLEEYLELPSRGRRKRPRAEKTSSEYRRIFKANLEEWKTRKASEITRADVERWHARIGKGHGNYTANRALALLRALLNHAVDMGHVDANPANRVRPFEERKRNRALSAAELPAFWSAIDAEGSVGDLFRLALLTGARRSNVLAARWEQFDLTAKTWRIPRTKSGQPLVIPLSPPAVEVLGRLAAARTCDLVFPDPANQDRPMELPRAAWDRIREAAGVPDLRFHDLRRSLASWQASTGANLSTIGKSLGHGSIEATKIYAHADLEAVRASVERATEAIVAAAKKKEPAGQLAGGLKESASRESE